MVQINSFLTSPIARYAIETLFGIASPQGPEKQNDVFSAPSLAFSGPVQAAAAKIDAALLETRSDDTGNSGVTVLTAAAEYEASGAQPPPPLRRPAGSGGCRSAAGQFSSATRSTLSIPPAPR